MLTCASFEADVHFIAPHAEDTALMRQLIRESYAKIRKQEFYEGCGKPNCAWCNFVKREGGVDRIERVVVGEMDDEG